VWLTPPGPYWLDCPELSAAVHRLGSPHPTGFPLYCWVGKLVALLPLGEIAWRVHVFSAICGSLALFFLAELLLEFEASEGAGWVGALAACAALGCCLLFARHATSAEVYAPTAALLSATALLFARVLLRERPADGIMLAVACGLGLAVHTSYRLAGIPVIALLIARWRRGARWPLLAPLVTCVVGIGLQLYLPVRAATGRISGVNWGDPSDLAGFRGHVSASSIRYAFHDEMFSSHLEVVLTNARTFAGQVQDYLGPLALVMAVVGGAVLLRRPVARRWMLLYWGVVAVGDAIYAFYINPMGLGDVQNGAPLALALAALAGFGTAWFARMLGRAAPYAGAVLVLFIGVPPLLAAWEPLTASAYSDLPRRWGEAALADIPSRGVALSESDSTSAALLFLQEVEQARPDADALVRQHALAVREGSLPTPGPMLFAALLKTGVPVAWEIGTTPAPAGRQLKVGTPLSALVPTRSPGDDIGAATAELSALFDDPGAADAEATRMEAHALTNLGRVAMGRGEVARGALLFDAAIAFKPDQVEALVNRGVVASYQGDLRAALAFTERALALEPLRVRALINAGRYRRALSDAEGAKAAFAKVLEVEPENSEARAGMETGNGSLAE
jgi:tetratricopeptide (TPR) repeat protein